MSINAMMTKLPFIFPGRIYRSPMPYSTYDWGNVWQSYLSENINLVIVLAEQQEYLVYAKRDLPEFYLSSGLDVLHIPVPDFGIPEDLPIWEQGLNRAAQTATDGKNVAVHCLAGIGRTGTFMACLAKENLGLSGEEAILWVRESIPGAMENNLQEQFIINYQSGIPV